MKWWKYILIGIFYFIFHFIIYQDIIGGGLIDEHDAWSPLAEPLGALCSIAGVILIVVGIIGYFFPGFLKWPNFVFENWDKLWHIFKVVVFIVYQMILLLVICYAFIYEEITEKASGFFPLVIVLAVPVVIHWVFILSQINLMIFTLKLLTILKPWSDQVKYPMILNKSSKKGLYWGLRSAILMIKWAV